MKVKFFKDTYIDPMNGTYLHDRYGAGIGDIIINKEKKEVLLIADEYNGEVSDILTKLENKNVPDDYELKMANGNNLLFVYEYTYGNDFRVMPESITIFEDKTDVNMKYEMETRLEEAREAGYESKEKEVEFLKNFFDRGFTIDDCKEYLSDIYCGYVMQAVRKYPEIFENPKTFEGSIQQFAEFFIGNDCVAFNFDVKDVKPEFREYHHYGIKKLDTGFDKFGTNFIINSYDYSIEGEMFFIKNEYLGSIGYRIIADKIIKFLKKLDSNDYKDVTTESMLVCKIAD